MLYNTGMKTSRDNSYMITYDRVNSEFEKHYPDILEGTSVDKDKYFQTIQNTNTIILKTKKAALTLWISIFVMIFLVFILAIPTFGLSAIIIIPFYCYIFLFYPKQLQDIMKEATAYAKSESENYYEQQGFRLECVFEQELGPVHYNNGRAHQSNVYIPVMFLTPLKKQEQIQEVTKEVVISVPQVQDTYLDENQLVAIELFQGDGFSKEDALNLVLEHLNKDDLQYLTDDDISKLNISVKGKTVIRKMIKK
eukprot:gene128-4374_t